MPVIEIDDRDDQRLSLYANVPDAELLRVHGAFVAEGRLVVRRLLSTRSVTMDSVLVTRPALDGLADLPATHPDLPFFVVPQTVINDIAGFNIHRGCLAVGQRPAERTLEMVSRGAQRVVVLEKVSNADNVGGIFRCAEALGAGAVVMGPHCADPLYRKAIRTSIGATLLLPFAGADWPDGLDALRRMGFRIVALTPAADAQSVDEAARELRPSARLALLAGAEGEGLSAKALAHADVCIRIPMVPAVDSLNVTVAVGIALQRLGTL